MNHIVYFVSLESNFIDTVKDRDLSDFTEDIHFGRLKKDIEEKGIINPVILQPMGEIIKNEENNLVYGDFKVIAGKRRIAACELIHEEQPESFSSIPAFLLEEDESDPKDVFSIAYRDNEFRKGLDNTSKAVFIAKFLPLFFIKEEETPAFLKESEAIKLKKGKLIASKVHSFLSNTEKEIATNFDKKAEYIEKAERFALSFGFSDLKSMLLFVERNALDAPLYKLVADRFLSVSFAKALYSLKFLPEGVSFYESFLNKTKELIAGTWSFNIHEHFFAGTLKEEDYPDPESVTFSFEEIVELEAKLALLRAKATAEETEKNHSIVVIKNIAKRMKKMSASQILEITPLLERIEKILAQAEETTTSESEYEEYEEYEEEEEQEQEIFTLTAEEQDLHQRTKD